MFLEITDHEYANLFDQSNPAPIAEANGSRYFSVPGPAAGMEFFVLADPGDGSFFLGKFGPEAFESFRADLKELRTEELMIKYGSPALQAAYYGVSMN